MKNKLFTEKRRIIELILIALVMNFTLFLISYYLNLPLWLDTTGTIYISCIVGFPAGFLVAIVVNVAEAIWMYGENSLLFYFVSLLTALTAGKVYERYKNTRLKKWCVMLLALIIVSCSSAVLITFLVNDGIPSNYSSAYLYEMLMNKGCNGTLSTCLSVAIIKCLDIVVTLLIVFLAIKITPEKLKTRNVVLLETVEE